MSLFSVNWLAVAACVVISMVSGMVWYNPRTFFTIWWKGIGKSDTQDPGAGGSMALTWSLTILSSAVQAAFIAIAVNIAIGATRGNPLLVGPATGFALWLGIVAPTNLVNKLFAGHGLTVWAIEAGNHMFNFILFGLVLGAWR